MKRIAHITDIHLKEQDPINLNVSAERNWAFILADAMKEQVDEVVFGGDIGDPSSLQWFFDSLEPFSYKIIIGNHDDYKDVVQYFDKNTAAQKELYYTDEDTFYRYVYLDTSKEHVSVQQLAWLKEQITTNKKIIIFMHHPVLAVNTPVDRAYPMENREEVRQCLLNSKKDITIFCGHCHMADEQRTDNILQIITPASSYQVVKAAAEIEEDGSTFGYRIITIDKDVIETQVKMFINDAGDY